MGTFSVFALEHTGFLVLLILPDLVLIRFIIVKLTIRLNGHVLDALGGRNAGRSFYKGCRDLVERVVNEYEGREKKVYFYTKAKERLKKAGYRGKYAAVVYLLLKYILSTSLFVSVFIANYPGIGGAVLLYCFVLFVIEGTIIQKRRKLNLKFQRCIYKVYKYLHNQIASGVKVTDAVKTVYEVSEDDEIRGMLMQLSARYELTLDIDSALAEFRSNFYSEEADTLCIALKQGIITGDNRELLARQEDVMFKKYFNYIQAETDNCKLRSIAAAALFTTVVAIMIIMPLLNEINESLSKIFIN